MTDDERQELVAAVREALGPFKEELKAEMQTELLEPMETRLRSEMGEMESRLRGEMGEMETRLGARLERLEAEGQSITNDVIGPFIKMAEARHRELVEQLDRLERQVERNRTGIEQVYMRVDQQERRLFSISDDVAVMRKHLGSLERHLIGELTYDVTQAELVLAEERSIYEMIRELEERVARLEGGSE